MSESITEYNKYDVINLNETSCNMTKLPNGADDLLIEGFQSINQSLSKWLLQLHCPVTPVALLWHSLNLHFTWRFCLLNCYISLAYLDFGELFATKLDYGIKWNRRQILQLDSVDGCFNGGWIGMIIWNEVHCNYQLRIDYNYAGATVMWYLFKPAISLVFARIRIVQAWGTIIANNSTYKYNMHPSILAPVTISLTFWGLTRRASVCADFPQEITYSKLAELQILDSIMFDEVLSRCLEGEIKTRLCQNFRFLLRNCQQILDQPDMKAKRRATITSWKLI